MRMIRGAGQSTRHFFEYIGRYESKAKHNGGPERLVILEINPQWPACHPSQPCSRCLSHLDQAGKPPQCHLGEQHPIERGVDGRGAGITCLPARRWAAGPFPIDGGTKRAWRTKLGRAGGHW